MAAPAVGLVALLLFLPLAMTFYFSFTDWQGFGFEANWSGLRNYRLMLDDDLFTRSLGVAVFIAVSTTVMLNVGGLFFASLLNHPGRTTVAYRAVFFFPMMLSAVVVGFLWRAMLDYDGIINGLLGRLGVERLEFLGDPNLAVLSIVGVIVWQSIGFSIIIYLAGLQNIPRELLEAARLDGAGRWATYRHITFRMLAPATTVNVVSIFIFNMREYDRIKTITQGAPAGMTQTLAYKVIRDALDLGELGKASAEAASLMMTVGVVSFGLVLLLRRREQDIT